MSPARRVLRICLGALLCALCALPGRPDPARAQMPPPAGMPDSVRLGGPVRTLGGKALSGRRVREALPEGIVGRAEIRGGLVRLGRELVDQGYLEAELRLAIENPPVLSVSEGPPSRWDTLLVRVGGERTSPGLLTGPDAAAGPNVPRGTFDAARFERLVWNWVDLWTEGGYPFASARVESVSVRDGRVRAGLRLDPGPRARVTTVEFPGRTSTRPDFLRKWIRFDAGDLYRESDWAACRRRLEQSGLFERVGDPVVETLPADGAGAAAADTAHEGSAGRGAGAGRAGAADAPLRVLLPVEEGPHNRLEGALGYSGNSRTVSGFADLDLGDLFGTGRHLGFHWERYARSQSRIKLQYREPLLGPLPVGARLSVEQEVQDSTYTQTVWEALAEAWVGADLTAFAGAEVRRSLLGREPAELTRRISSVVGGTWDTERPGLWRGGRVTASFRSGQSRVRPAGGGAIQRFRLDRAEMGGEQYLSLGGLILRGSFRGAAVSRGDLAVSEALRFGGAGTVRGYREEQFTAQRFGAAQFEIGLPLPEGRVYLFADGGWYRRFGSESDSDLLSAGIGLSAETSARKITVDLGFPRGGALGEGRLHLRVETRF